MTLVCVTPTEHQMDSCLGELFFLPKYQYSSQFSYFFLFSFLWISTSISSLLFFIITFLLGHPYAYWFVILVSICAMICVSVISMDLLFLQESALVLQLSCFISVRNLKYLYIFRMDYESQSTSIILSL